MPRRWTCIPPSPLPARVQSTTRPDDPPDSQTPMPPLPETLVRSIRSFEALPRAQRPLSPESLTSLSDTDTDKLSGADAFPGRATDAGRRDADRGGVGLDPRLHFHHLAVLQVEVAVANHDGVRWGVDYVHLTSRAAASRPRRWMTAAEAARNEQSRATTDPASIYSALLSAVRADSTTTFSRTMPDAATTQASPLAALRTIRTWRPISHETHPLRDAQAAV